MSATGILRPDEVIFYHPLDNYTEHTQSQAWSGTAGFVSGKIPAGGPLGLSAITGDTFSFTQGGAWATATGAPDSKPPRMAMLDSTHVVVKYMRSSNERLRVGTISGADVTWGAENTTGGSYGQSLSHQNPVLAMDASTVLVPWLDGAGAGQGKLVVGKVSGTDITFGAATSFGVAGDTCRQSGLAKLDSTTALLAQSDGLRDLYVYVVTVSGNTTTIGSGTLIESNATEPSIMLDTIDSSRVLICWAENAVKDGYVAVLSVSGTDVTIGTSVNIGYCDLREGDLRVQVQMLTSSTFVVAHFDDLTANFKIKVGTVTGTSVTVGAANTFSLKNMYTLMKADSTTFFLHGRSQAGGSNQEFLRKFTVSGTDVTGGAESFVSAVLCYETQSVTIGSDKVVCVHEVNAPSSFDSYIAQLGVAASLSASAPGAYPAATGDDRVTVAAWAKNMTAGSSTITVQRDYKVELTATTITLGPASAVWSGASITSLMSTMNDGNDHLLVLDFEHTGGGSWNLETSVDGAAWASQGAGTGTRTTSPASADPNIAIDDGESGQWVDEVVVWAGDKTTFTQFTSEELANLHDLADTFGEPMDQYENNYGAPICWQATATMPDGTVWRDSGSGPCPAVIRVPRGASDIVVTDEGKPASPRILEG